MKTELVEQRKALIGKFETAKTSGNLSQKFIKSYGYAIKNASSKSEMNSLHKMIESGIKQKNKLNKDTKATISKKKEKYAVDQNEQIEQVLNTDVIEKPDTKRYGKVSVNMMFFELVDNADVPILKRNKGVKIIKRHNKYYGQRSGILYLDMEVNNQENTHMIEFEEKKFNLLKNINEKNKKLFNKIVNVASQEFAGIEYSDSVVIWNYNKDITDNDIETVENVLDVLNQSFNKEGINSKYTITNITNTTGNFSELMQKTQYYNDECFINAFIKQFKKSKFPNSSEDTIRKNLIRLMNLNEETIKKGVSVNMMKPVFLNYGLFLQVYNNNYRLIYDNQINSHHGMKCLMKDSHIYLLDKNAKKIVENVSSLNMVSIKDFAVTWCKYNRTCVIYLFEQRTL